MATVASFTRALFIPPAAALSRTFRVAPFDKPDVVPKNRRRRMSNDGARHVPGSWSSTTIPTSGTRCKEVLEDEGYEVNGVGNGREALDYLRRRRGRA